MISLNHEEAVQHQRNLCRLGHFGSSFPSDLRPAKRDHIRNQEGVCVSSELWSKFNAACDHENVKPAYALLGLLHILLHRYTVADSIGTGLLQGNVLPVSTEITGSMSVRSSISATSRSADASAPYSYSELDLKMLHEDAGAGFDLPLFRVILSAGNLPSTASTQILGNMNLAAAQCEMFFCLHCEDGQTHLVLEYDADLYKGETVRRILSQFQFMVESFEGILEQPVARVSLCPADEAYSLLRETIAKTSYFPVVQCVHQRFEEQARETPDAVALVVPGNERHETTYSQLNAAANRLARYLQSQGVGPDVLVGLYLDRTPDLIVGLLAILKAGGAYLPIDLSYPTDRVAFMLSDAEAPIVITDSKTACNLAQTSAAIVCVDKDAGEWSELSAENLISVVQPDNLAYSIFTSGSTGKPKGVLITHANVSRLFDATQAWFHFNEQDTWTFFHSCAFDFSVWEIWGALIYGGRLVIVPFSDSRSPERFRKLLASERVTVLNQTPSAFRQLIGIDEKKPGDKLDRLRLVIFGGEALNLQSLAPWFSKYGDVQPQLVNMYGITETTVHVTYRPLSSADLREARGSVIGVPIPDLRLYVLDAGLQPVPIGIPGEIFVGGAGVAQGYLKRCALTAERFIKNPFSGSDEKLYRSGDLAKRLPGGDLEYLGRADQQVKIRGFRVELGEIESALTKQPSVREAFVTAKELCDGEKVLVAYVVPANGGSPAVDRLRRNLELTLPGYMVPGSFVFLEHLPLTSNGKVDRIALPAASLRRSEMDQPFLAPQTDLERKIAGIYKDVLQLDKVGIDDNFFDLGGNSLRLVEVHARLENLIGRQISLADLFAYTTVRKLAASIRNPGVQRKSNSDLLNRAQRQRQAMVDGRIRRRCR
jgi:amino acid adenylation domain-containing protein